MDSESFNISDLNLFKKFFKNKTIDFKNYYYIPYLLLSPIYKYNEKKNHDAYMPLIIMIKHKTDKKDYRFEEIHINYSSLDFYPLFTYIKNKSLSALNNLKSFEKFLTKKVIKINPLDVEEMTLEEVTESSYFYRKYKPFLTEHSKKEKFYKFEDLKEDKTYIISSIEVVRFFYTYGKFKSLGKALLHPMGLNLLIDNMYQTVEGYHLKLHNDCKKDDATFALYFYHQEYIENMFNEVNGNLHRTKYLYAPFPTYKTLEIYCNCYKIRENEYLITNIIDTTLFNELKKKHKEIIHPNDKKQDQEKNGEKRSPKPKFTKDYDETPENNDLDDENPSNPYLPSINVTEEKESPFKQIEDDIEYIKNGTKGAPRQTGINIKFEKKPYTTQNSEGENKGGQKIDKEDALYPTDLKEVPSNLSMNNLGKVLKYFKYLNYNYEVKTYQFPDKIKSNGKYKTIAISYVNDDMTIKRIYTIIRFHKENNVFFYLDVEPKDKMKKEVLIIIKNIPIEDMQNKYISKIIYDQVNKGNHKWLSKYHHDIHDKEYKAFKHTENMYKNIKRFIEGV